MGAKPNTRCKPAGSSRRCEVPWAPRELVISLVLVGDSGLDTLLHRPDLEALRSRLACVARLRLLSRPETRSYISELMQDFPEIDLIEELKAWRRYRLENPTKLKSPRGALRRWMIKARELGL